MTAVVQSERDFERAVVDYAKLQGWLVHHHFDSRRSEPGWPDLALVRDRVLVLVELKTDKGRVSRAQEAWIDALIDVEMSILDAFKDRVPFNDRQSLLERVGLKVFVWRPSMWGEIERILARQPKQRGSS